MAEKDGKKPNYPVPSGLRDARKRGEVPKDPGISSCCFATGLLVFDSVFMAVFRRFFFALFFPKFGAAG